MSSYRIAFLSEHASPIAVLGGVDAGGQNVYVDELSRLLGEAGHTVDVFTRWGSFDAPDIVKWAPNVRVIQLRAGPPRRVLKDDLWPHMPAFRDALLRFMQREKHSYDLIHANFWMSGWVATEIKRELGLPVVQIFHATGNTKRRVQGADDTSPSGRVDVETVVAQAVDRVIAQCPAERDELIDDYGMDPSRISLVPSAVNIQRFRPVDPSAARQALGLDLHMPIVGYVGRMLPRKGIRNLVRAVASLREMDPPVQLLIVGGETETPHPDATPEIGVLRELAAQLGISDRLILTGRRQPDILWLYYGAADVMVSTPRYEPFGLTPLEAMACARPMVGSDVGGIRFTIEDGRTGFLVPPDSPQILADRLRTLLEDRELRGRMGAAGRERVEREFTWRRTAERTASLYGDVLASRDTQNDPRHEVETLRTQTGDEDIDLSTVRAASSFWS